MSYNFAKRLKAIKDKTICFKSFYTKSNQFLVGLNGRLFLCHPLQRWLDIVSMSFWMDIMFYYIIIKNIVF